MWGKRILGIDANGHSFRVVQMQRGPAGRISLSRAGLCSTWGELEELLGDPAWLRAGDRVALGFPSDRVVIRGLRVPFRDPDRIEQTLPFEMEREVPFSAEEIIVGYLLKERTLEGSHLWAMAAPTEALRGWLERFSAMGLAPPVVEPQIASLVHLVPRLFTDPPESFCILDASPDIGHLLIFGGAQLRALRVLKGGIQGEEPGERLIPEVTRSLKAFRARGETPPPRVLYLCGELGTRPRAAHLLGTRLSLPVQVLDPLGPLATSRSTLPPEAPCLFASAVGLTLGAASGSSCNLRAGELAFRPGLGIYGRLVWAAVLLLLLALGTAGGDLYAKVHIKRRTIQALKARMEAILREDFPHVGEVVEPVLQMQRLLEKRKGDELTLLAQDPAASVVELLREISLRVQARSRLRLTQLDLSEEFVTLRGEADGYSTVESAKDRWQQSPLLESVEIKSAKKNPETGRWEFQCVAKRRVP